MPEQNYITVEGLFLNDMDPIPFTGQPEPGFADLVKVNFECRCGGHEEPAWVVRYHISPFLNSLSYNFNSNDEADVWINHCQNCDPQPEPKAVGAGV